MTRRARVQPAARNDLRHLAEWLHRKADPATAGRVIAAARQGFAKLAKTPGLGAPAKARSNDLAQARRWRVERFANYLIFYEPDPRGGVVILRVLRAAQDWKQS